MCAPNVSRSEGVVTFQTVLVIMSEASFPSQLNISFFELVLQQNPERTMKHCNKNFSTAIKTVTLWFLRGYFVYWWLVESHLRLWLSGFFCLCALKLWEGGGDL